uniref:Cylicin_N domain-containing protein n=1 Tax=Steinernema glaseri TaxID=37863 RepID=A0A1I7ZZY6_9BILA
MFIQRRHETEDRLLKNGIASREGREVSTWVPNRFRVNFRRAFTPPLALVRYRTQGYGALLLSGRSGSLRPTSSPVGVRSATATEDCIPSPTPPSRICDCSFALRQSGNTETERDLCASKGTERPLKEAPAPVEWPTRKQTSESQKKSSSAKEEVVKDPKSEGASLKPRNLLPKNKEELKVYKKIVMGETRPAKDNETLEDCESDWGSIQKMETISEGKRTSESKKKDGSEEKKKSKQRKRSSKSDDNSRNKKKSSGQKLGDSKGEGKEKKKKSRSGSGQKKKKSKGLEKSGHDGKSDAP